MGNTPIKWKHDVFPQSRGVSLVGDRTAGAEHRVFLADERSHQSELSFRSFRHHAEKPTVRSCQLCRDKNVVQGVPKPRIVKGVLVNDAREEGSQKILGLEVTVRSFVARRKRTLSKGNFGIYWNSSPAEIDAAANPSAKGKLRLQHS